jgi:hypothetical protein
MVDQRGLQKKRPMMEKRKQLDERLPDVDKKEGYKRNTKERAIYPDPELCILGPPSAPR